MEKTVYIVLALVALATIGVVYTNKMEPEDVVVVETEITNLAEGLLGSKPSEDASELLQFPNLPEYTYSFSPEPRIEYLVHLEGDKRLSNREIVKMYEQLQEEIGAWFLLYGRVEDTWTIPREKLGAMISYDELVVSSLLVDYEGNPQPAEELEKINQIAEQMAGELELTTRYEESVDVASERAEMLSNFWHEYDQWIFLVLEADPGESFTGTEIHDAALALGLEWDEMSLNYHWLNKDELVGDRVFFSMGDLDGADLDPEEMAQENFASPGVVFGFYLPISGAPKEVYENMVTAVKYFQERMGGTIQDLEGRKLDDGDLEWIDTVIQEMAQEMEDAGIQPGHNLALWLYEAMMN